MSSCGNNYLTDVYAVKKEQSNDWVPFGSIKGFYFEKEYDRIFTGFGFQKEDKKKKK